MNKTLSEWYHSLSTKDQSILLQRFANSPVILQLIAFLSQREKGNFKTRDAVQFLYADDLDKVPYNKLQNRYFKMRKQLLSAYQQSSTEIDTMLIPEEHAYYKSRQLIIDGDIQSASQLLKELEKQCWRLNMFELLPDIIRKRIYCHQVFFQHDKTISLIDRLKEAIVLEKDIREVQLIASTAYNTYITKGYARAKQLLDKIKAYAHLHKTYPRFQMSYQMHSLVVGSDVGGKNVQALSRHYNKLKGLRKQHPDMPIATPQPHYQKTASAYLLGREMAINFFKGDAEASHDAMLRQWQIHADSNYNIRLGERAYINRINMELFTGRHQNAFKTAQSLMAHARENNRNDSLLRSYKPIMECYAMKFSGLHCNNPQYFLKKMDTLLAFLKRTKNVYLGGTLLTKAMFCAAYQYHRKGLNALKQEACMQFLEELKLHELFPKLLLLLKAMDAAPQAEKKAKMIKQLKKAMGNDKSIQRNYYLDWGIKMLLNHRVHSVLK